MARKGSPTILQEELYPLPGERSREEIDDARMLDLDADSGIALPARAKARLRPSRPSSEEDRFRTHVGGILTRRSVYGQRRRRHVVPLR